jgi:hypothetical protein
VWCIQKDGGLVVDVPDRIAVRDSTCDEGSVVAARAPTVVLLRHEV